MRFLFALLVCCSLVLPALAQTTAVRAGLLVDPEAGTATPGQTILIDGGIITAIGSDVTIPGGATVVDLSDLTVMPGMFDAHAHMCLTVRRERDGGNYYVTNILNTTPYRAIEGVANARAMLNAGFTTIRDIGNAGLYADTALRKAIEDGLVPGPTMQNAGRIIAPFGGQYYLQPEKVANGQPEYFFADTRDELLKAIRENIHFGATFIKVVVDDQPYMYSAEDIRFVVEEAGRAGLKVAAHCWTEQGAINAIQGGVASIEHGVEMSDATLEMARDAGVVLVGTEFTELMVRESLGETDPGAITAFNDQMVDRLRRAYDLGVTIAFGSDVVFAYEGYDRGTLSLTVLDSFKEAGLPNAATLQALTTNAAHLMGLANERGALRPGLAADLIALPGNPLDDLDVLKQVRFVMKDGTIFRDVP